MPVLNRTSVIVFRTAVIDWDDDRQPARFAALTSGLWGFVRPAALVPPRLVAFDLVTFGPAQLDHRACVETTDC